MESKKRKTTVWKYFKELPEKKSKCKVCCKAISCVNTTNMRSNLKVNHHSSFAALNQYHQDDGDDDDLTEVDDNINTQIMENDTITSVVRFFSLKKYPVPSILSNLFFFFFHLRQNSSNLMQHGFTKTEKKKHTEF